MAVGVNYKHNCDCFLISVVLPMYQLGDDSIDSIYDLEGINAVVWF